MGRRKFQFLIASSLVLILSFFNACGEGFESSTLEGHDAAIEEGTVDEGMPQTQPPPPTPPPPPPVGPPMTNTSYAELSSKILLVKCLRCHNVNRTASPGVYFYTYQQSVSQVLPGRPLESPMYKAAKRITGPNSVISEAELQYISDWILDGARDN